MVFKVSGYYSVFDEFSTANFLVEQTPTFIECEENLNLLEAVSIADEHLSTGIISLSILVQFRAGFVINIDLSLDDLATALAFDRK